MDIKLIKEDDKVRTFWINIFLRIRFSIFNQHPDFFRVQPQSGAQVQGHVQDEPVSDIGCTLPQIEELAVLQPINGHVSLRHNAGWPRFVV